ncbi:MAG: hypothetical protein FJW88_00300 [Actinobacteria bacterium]|nr:hypothetical protein [Actinomycetota bacterium]
MGITSGVYKVLLVAHVLSAIVGLLTVFLNGLYARESKRRPEPGGLAISRANLTVSLVAEKAIYAVFLLGVLIPTSKRINVLLDERVSAGPPAGAAAGPPPQVAQVEALDRRAGSPPWPCPCSSSPSSA